MSEAQPSKQPVVRLAPPAEVAQQFGVGRLARHVLFCPGPSCCDPELGDRVWSLIKQRLAGLGLVGNRPHGPAVYRTRCDCLRMCSDGPIMVVYPEGAWYQKVDEAAAERIVAEHVVGGRVVEELCFAIGPLSGGALAGIGVEVDQEQDASPGEKAAAGSGSAQRAARRDVLERGS